MAKNDKEDEPYVSSILSELFITDEPKRKKSTAKVSKSKAKQKIKFADETPHDTWFSDLSKQRKITYAVIAVVVFLFIIARSPVGLLIQEKSLESSTPDNIKVLADKAGFSIRGKLLFFRAHPELVDADTLDQKCPGSGDNVEFGCYLSQENKIYILAVPDSKYISEEYSTSAHEMLHAAWHFNSSDVRENVASMIDVLYKGNTTASQQLHDELKPYGSDQSVVYSELHSFIGSEYNTSYLGSGLASYYNRYFVNQTLPVTANDDFNNAINTEFTNLDSEYNNISSEQDKNDQYKAQWLDPIDRALQYDDYIGDYYTYNKNVDAYNHNLTYYNQQVDQIKSQISAYNAEVDSFNAVLKSFYPTRTQAKLFTQ